MKTVFLRAAAIVLILLVGEAIAAVSFQFIKDADTLAEIRVLRGEVARVFAHDHVTDFRPSPAVIHPYLGYVLVPGGSINAYGFLGRPPVDHGSDAFVIGIFGGSLAAQFTINGGPEAILKAVGDAPFLQGREVQFVSVAQGGYKQPQQLFALQYLMLLGKRFDVVVNIDGLNEILQPIKNSEHGRVNPIYPGAWGYHVKESFNANFEGTGRVVVLQLTRYIRQGLAKGIDFFSAFPNHLLDVVWFGFDKTLKRWIYTLNKRAERVFAYGDSFSATGPPFSDGDSPSESTLGDSPSESTLIDASVQIWKQASIFMNDLSAHRGISYFHFLQPNQYVEGSKQFSEEEKQNYRLDTYDYARATAEGYERLISAGRSVATAGIPYMSLVDAFEGIEETLYADECCHVNRRANQILGSVIGRFILAHME